MTAACPACGNPSRDGGLCDNDEENLTDNLALAPDLLDQLLIQATRQSVTSTGTQSADAETALPVNLKASDLAARYEHLLVSWARVLGNDTPGLDGRRAAWWMRERIYDARIHAQAAELAGQLVTCARDCWHAIDRHGADLVFLGDCQKERDDQPCGTPIRVRKGHTTATCWRCNSEYNVADMLEQRDARINESLATAAEITSAHFRTPNGRLINTKMIEGYVRRGSVAAHGVKHGARTYRIGEVKDAALRAEYPKARLSSRNTRLIA